MLASPTRKIPRKKNAQLSTTTTAFTPILSHPLAAINCRP